MNYFMFTKDLKKEIDKSHIINSPYKILRFLLLLLSIACESICVSYITNYND